MAVFDAPLRLHGRSKSPSGSGSPDVPFLMMIVRKQISFLSMILVLDFWAFEKVVFELCYAVLPPPQGQSTPRSPYGLKPLIS